MRCTDTRTFPPGCAGQLLHDLQQHLLAASGAAGAEAAAAAAAAARAPPMFAAAAAAFDAARRTTQFASPFMQALNFSSPFSQQLQQQLLQQQQPFCLTWKLGGLREVHIPSSPAFAAAAAFAVPSPMAATAQQQHHHHLLWQPQQQQQQQLQQEKERVTAEEEEEASRHPLRSQAHDLQQEQQEQQHQQHQQHQQEQEQQQQQQAIAAPFSRERRSEEETRGPEDKREAGQITWREAWHVFGVAALPMVGFGLMDQLIMIRLGDVSKHLQQQQHW